MSQTKAHLKRHLPAIGMQQFAKDALIAGLKVNSIL
jgi:hypothetical protein